MDWGLLKVESTVKSQIFVRYLISYFPTFEKKVLNLIPYENFFSF